MSEEKNLIFVELMSKILVIGERHELGIKNPYIIAFKSNEEKDENKKDKNKSSYTECVIFPAAQKDVKLADGTSINIGQNKDFIISSQNIYGLFEKIPEFIAEMYINENSVIKKPTPLETTKINNTNNIINLNKLKK